MENKVKTSHENTTRHDILYICLTKPHIDHYVIYFELANNDHVNSNNAKCNVSTWNNQRIIFFFHADFRLKCDTFFVCCWLGILDNIEGFIWNQATMIVSDGFSMWMEQELLDFIILSQKNGWALMFNVQTIFLVVMMPSRSAVTWAKTRHRIKYIVVNEYFYPYMEKTTNHFRSD